MRAALFRAALPAALAAGLVLRLAYAWHGHTRAYIPTSSDAYETIALSMIERGEYSLEAGTPTSFREPTYPLFIAAVYGLCGQRPWAVLLLQCLMGAAACWLLYKTALPLFGESIALLAAWGLALHPQAIYYCAYFFRETLMAFLFTLLLWCSRRWAAPENDPEAPYWCLASGLSAALWALSNSAVLPAALLCAVLAWLAAPAARRAERAALVLLPVVLGFGLWTARNFAAHGMLVLGSTHGGEELYQALIVPPEDLGTSRQTEIVGADFYYQEIAGAPEAQRNRFLMIASAVFIANHPATFLSRAAAGIVKFWRPWPYKRSYDHSYALLVAVSLLSDGWIIPLGLWGLWLFRARWRELPALPAGVLGLTVVYGCVHAVIRYRLPLMGGMLVLALAAGRELLLKFGILPRHPHG